MEFIVAGKRVVLKDRIPAKANWGLMQALQKFGSGEMEFDQVAALFATIVSEWEFEGNPNDAAAYAELDLFTEFMPLMNRVGDYVGGALQPEKN